MRRAVRANRVQFTSHSLDELEAEGYTKADAYSCILTGDIVEDQFDLRFRQVKYKVYGEAKNGDELGLIARFDDASGVIIITAFQLTVEDYD